MTHLWNNLFQCLSVKASRRLSLSLPPSPVDLISRNNNPDAAHNGIRNEIGWFLISYFIGSNHICIIFIFRIGNPFVSNLLGAKASTQNWMARKKKYIYYIIVVCHLRRKWIKVRIIASESERRTSESESNQVELVNWIKRKEWTEANKHVKDSRGISERKRNVRIRAKYKLL